MGRVRLRDRVIGPPPKKGTALRELLAHASRVNRTHCPNDGVMLVPSDDPQLAGCLECRACGFVQGFGDISVP